jgi:hypothetical protein
VTAIAEETALEQYERRLIEVVDEMEKGARLGPLDDYALLRSARDALQVRRERIESLSAENAELRALIDDLMAQKSKAEGALAGVESGLRLLAGELEGLAGGWELAVRTRRVGTEAWGEAHGTSETYRSVAAKVRRLADG